MYYAIARFGMLFGNERGMLIFFISRQAGIFEDPRAVFSGITHGKQIDEIPIFPGNISRIRPLQICEGLGSTGPTPPGRTTHRSASNRAHLSHRDARPDAEVFYPQGAHSVGGTEPWGESVP